MLARADRPQGTSDRTLSTFQTNSGADMVIQNSKNRLAILYILNSASPAVPALGKICTLSRRPDDIGTHDPRQSEADDRGVEGVIEELAQPLLAS